MSISIKDYRETVNTPGMPEEAKKFAFSLLSPEDQNKVHQNTAPTTAVGEPQVTEQQTSQTESEPAKPGQFWEIAMQALERGETRVLPIAVGGKQPLVQWKNSPIDTASKKEWDRDHALEWIDDVSKKFPDANVCVIAKPDEFVFIDCDTTEEFIAGYEKFSGEKFPVTYTTSARQNRTQMHFQQTDRTRTMGNIHQFAVEGIDLSVRQHNMYVLAEGSNHPSGSVYRKTVDAPIAPMPDKMVEYIGYLKRKASGATEQEARVSSGNSNFDTPDYVRQLSGIADGDIDSVLKLLPDIQEGGRDNFLSSVLGKLHHEKWSNENVLLVSLKINEQKCHPPIKDPERVAKSMCRYEDKPAPPVPFNGYSQSAGVCLSEERLDQEQEKWMKFTDIQNSREFALEHKQDVRAFYGGINKQTAWYVWDGARWKEDSGGVVMRFAKKTAENQLRKNLKLLSEAMIAQAPTKELQKQCQAAQQCCSHYRLISMLGLAAAEPEISVKMTDLDGQPNLLNFNNGTFDLEKMELRPHRKEDLLTQLIPIDYDQNQKCPKWERFISRIFQDKPYMPGYIQRVVGYCLPGRNPEQVFFMGYGGPGGGKTTFAQVLKALLGEYFRTAPQGLFLLTRERKSADQPNPAQAALYGSRLVVSEELDEAARLDSGLVKHVTGGGDVNVRQLFKPNFSFTPDYKILFLTNFTPKVTDFSGALEDRLRVIKFDQKLRDTAEEVKDYHLELIKELPGILNWALQGLRQQKQHGLQDPPEVMLATKQFMVQENVVSEWVDEMTEKATDGRITPAAAYTSFINWAKNRGENFKDMTPRWFSLRMAHLGYDAKPVHGVRYHLGLSFRAGHVPVTTPVLFNGYARKADVDFNAPLT